MASFKVSEFTGVANTTDDSLLMLSYTTDNGSTFQTRKIRVADFLDDITVTTKADLDVDDLETLTGAGAGAVNLGIFTGTTISDNQTIKAALQSLETAVEAAGVAITGGDGIDRTGDVVSVDLPDGGADYTKLTLPGMPADLQGPYTRTYNANIDGSGNWVPGTHWLFVKDGDSTRAVVYDSGADTYYAVESSAFNFSTGPAPGNAQPSYDQKLAQGSAYQIYDTFNQPSDNPNADYGILPGGYLEFAAGKLQVKALDEDTFSSNSAEHVPTQQSVKAYVDNGLAPKANTSAVYLLDGSQALTADFAAGGYKLTNLAAPTVGTDAATKTYVDSATSGQGAFFETVRAGSDTNVDIATGTLLTIDGISLVADDRVLLVGQTDNTENGIYLAKSGAWVRATDADAEVEFILNKTVYVSEGASLGGDVYALTTVPTTLEVDAVLFTKKQDSAGIIDGSITTVKLADLAVTNAKINDVDAAKITTGVLADARVQQSNVTQHEAALSLSATQITTGTFVDARIAQSNVTQHQAALSITESQISDLQAYALASTVAEIDGNVNDLITLSGVAENATSLGTFTGTVIPDAATVKSALQALETEIETLAVADLTDGGSVLQAGENINQLVGSTGADGEPASYLFCVVDQSDGSIKFIDKTFVEIE